MPDEKKETTTNDTGGSFISQSNANKVDTVYSDFFQETSDGKISVGSKARKSGLEIGTTILSYVLPIAIVCVLLGSAHVFIRNQESGSFAENYPFLCPYLNYGVDLDTDLRGCKTMAAITTEYATKQGELEGDIMKRLNEYIPIKITKNLMDTSPEKNFIVTTYNSKIKLDEIMNQFEKVLASAQYKQEDNISCIGISITGNGVVSTQCTIKGKDVGEDNTNGRLGSARIEAMNFIETLSDTNKSGFELLNPPTSLSIEDIPKGEDSSQFTTRTTLPIQIKYAVVSEAP